LGTVASAARVAALATSKHVRNECFHAGDKGIEIFFADKNAIFEIHEIICV